jgi:hypothetical protein
MAFAGSLMGLLMSFYFRYTTLSLPMKFTCAFYLVGRPHGPLLSYDGGILRCQTHMCPSHGSMTGILV